MYFNTHHYCTIYIIMCVSNFPCLQQQKVKFTLHILQLYTEDKVWQHLQELLAVAAAFVSVTQSPDDVGD